MRLRTVCLVNLCYLLLVLPAGADSSGVVTSSNYIQAKDGTRLAVDVHRPLNAADQKLPALLVLTRYLRSSIDPVTGKLNPALSPLDRYLLDHQYAIVKIDVRGSGASFGTRPAEYGPEEVRDGYAIVDWVVSQPWSNGIVGAYGTSYTGTTAELLTAANHPAVRAVIPGWSDFDAYTSPVRPYGLLASSFLSAWGQLVGWMDSNNPAMGSQVNPVADDANGELLAQALLEHRDNPDVFQLAVATEFRDDDLGGASWADLGPLHYRSAIQLSAVPMLVLVSWLDAGTADGALLRFQHFSNPQKLVITAGTHGGEFHASPYAVGSEPLPPVPSEQQQFELRRQFFDRHLKGIRNGVDDWPAIRFFNLGDEQFYQTDAWPPRGTRNTTFHMSWGGGLTPEAGAAESGTDYYSVDRKVNTGEGNRWAAQMGRPILNLDDRGYMDSRMLTYTTAPLEDDLQLSGTPVLHLQMSSDRTDGMVLAYLEDVDPQGRSRYLTEGGLRLIHRKVGTNPYFDTLTPYHSFARADAEPMPPHDMVPVSFQLWPISARIRKGHRLRLALAGADDAVFDQLPPDGKVNLTVLSGGAKGSRLVLPVVEASLQPDWSFVPAPVTEPTPDPTPEPNPEAAQPIQEAPPPAVVETVPARSDDTLAAEEIAFLLDALGNSRCTFIRNGRRHRSTTGESHLRSKYLKAREFAGTAEQFIDRIASISSTTTKAYQIKCTGRPVVDSRDWFLARLEEYRAER